ncbi:MAG: cyanophycin synthetase, partial [Coleofasciculus sp. C2-GNP5-27]
VSADHLGIGDIDTLDQMAHLKSVVAESVSPAGYAVLNAEDPLVTDMAQRVKGHVAFFSMNPDNEVVKAHTRQGGLAAVYENGYLSLIRGEWTLRIEKAEHVPVTMRGMAPFQIANALAASLAAFAQGVPIEAIRDALTTFRASVAQTPGRMNLFNLGEHHALVDYAHNAASYEAVGGFVRNWSGERIGVVGGPGDRRDEDFINLGRLSAEIFDRIIIKEDADLRGRSSGEAAELIRKGILETNPDREYDIILKETDAINTALDGVASGGLVVIFPEKVSDTIGLIEDRR